MRIGSEWASKWDQQLERDEFNVPLPGNARLLAKNCSVYLFEFVIIVKNYKETLHSSKKKAGVWGCQGEDTIIINLVKLQIVMAYHKILNDAYYKDW